MNNIGDHFTIRRFTIRSMTIVSLALAAIAVPTLFSPSTAIAERARADGTPAFRDQHYRDDRRDRDHRADRRDRPDRDRDRDRRHRDRKRDRDHHRSGDYYGGAHNKGDRHGYRSGHPYAYNNWHYANHWQDRRSHHARKHRTSGVILGLGLGLLTHQIAHIDRPRDRIIVVERPDSNPPAQWQSGQYQAQPVGYDPRPDGCLQTREYQTVVIIAGEEKAAYGQACLMPDGSWMQGPPMIEPDF